MNIQNTKILLIGAGNMGGALAHSWLHNGLPKSNLRIIEIYKKQITAFEGVDCYAEISNESTADIDCVVLAVKPQVMDGVLVELNQHIRTDTLLLSIAAGKTIAYYESQLGNNAAIVRAMPNTPAIIGKGISALIANKKVTEPQKQLADALLKTAGETVWLENEAQMDAVTALSGSGPAYVFLMLDALIEAGKMQGLNDATARTLAAQTFIGSAELAKASQESLEQLRKNVTSPGGTTEAALNVLMEKDALKCLLEGAVAAAAKRSRELA